MTVVCNPIRMGRGSELMVVCEADANDTSGELGSAIPGSLLEKSVFMTAKLEMLIESASWLALVSVLLEFQGDW